MAKQGVRPEGYQSLVVKQGQNGAQVAPPTALVIPQKEEKLTDFLDGLQKRRLAEAEIAKLTRELAVSTPTPVREEKRRYMVDPETGAISVSEDEGEYTYKDALLVSSSVRQQRQGQNEGTALFAAMRNLLELSRDLAKDKEETKAVVPVRRKVWDVDEDGTLIKNEEDGEYTLSEAQAVSRSRQRLLVGQSEPITPEKLELLRRDIKDEFKSELAQIVQALNKRSNRQALIKRNGEWQVNPDAEPQGWEYFVVEQLNKGSGGSSPLFRDEQGNVMPLPAWFDVTRFMSEERRKDDNHRAVTGLIEDTRKHLPAMINAFKGLQKKESSLKGSEWDEAGKGQAQLPAETAEEQQKIEVIGRQLKDRIFGVACATCGKSNVSLEGTKLLLCEHCGAINYLGPEEERAVVAEALYRSTHPAPEAKEAEKPMSSEPDSHPPGEEAKEQEKPLYNERGPALDRENTVEPERPPEATRVEKPRVGERHSEDEHPALAPEDIAGSSDAEVIKQEETKSPEPALAAKSRKGVHRGQQ